jgi:CheY-like chemotaxis protein
VSPGLTILSISSDESLLRIRSLLLRHWGYHVWSTATDSETLTLLESPATFDLALLCHSIPEQRRVSLVAAIKKRCPSLPIVMLQRGMTATEAAVDGACQSDMPENILSAIRRLTSPRPVDRTMPALRKVKIGAPMILNLIANTIARIQSRPRRKNP